jgi:N-acetylmuramoyl-L-alanine amidase
MLCCSGALVALLLSAVGAQAHAHHTQAATTSQFKAAEHLREALNQRAANQRTRHDYQRVINAYRRIYSEAPTSSRADSAAVAVAELLEEMGRHFDDRELLHSAVKQYQFLRREYPGSKSRFDALFRIGEIYKDDLHEDASARATFTEFLRRYPRNRLAEEARKETAPTEKQQALKAGKPQQTLARKPTHGSAAGSADDDGSADESTADESKSDDSEARRSEARSSKLAHVTAIRHWATPDYTRVAIDLEQDVPYETQRIENPDRVVLDLLDTKLDLALTGKSFAVDDGFLKKIRLSQFKTGQTRVVLEVDDDAEFNAFFEPNPARLIVDVREKPRPVSLKEVSTDARMPITSIASTPKKRIIEADDDDAVAKPESSTNKPIDTPGIAPHSSGHLANSTAAGKRKTAGPNPLAREAQPTASGDRSLTRALGLKIGRIVIDPGHGGHDTGTIGPNGLEEKDLVLDVSLRLGKLLGGRLGADVVYTRRDDTFIPLENRTAIANQEAADLFVSVHANSSHDPDARGVETYYLNFTSSPDALEVAARENAASDKSIHELQDLVKKIALKEKIDESREFAADVQEFLHGGLAAKNPGIRDRGVKQAPFIVLIGANMPSILAEISFVSNPGDERRLETAEYRQRIAESLYRGIAKYVSGLSGVKVASKMDKTADR